MIEILLLKIEQLAKLGPMEFRRQIVSESDIGGAPDIDSEVLSQTLQRDENMTSEQAQKAIDVVLGELSGGTTLSDLLHEVAGGE